MERAQIAYEFTRRAHDLILQMRAQNHERLHKLLLVTVVLFSALSYGMSQLASVPADVQPLLRIAPIVIAAIAAVFLGIAFHDALRLFQIVDVEVLSLDKIAEHVLKPEFATMTESQVWGPLAVNIAEAYKKILERSNAQKHQHQRLNFCLVAGYISVALFLASVMTARFAVPVTGKSQTQECHRMADENTSQTTQPAASQPSAATSESVGTTESQPAAQPVSLSPQDLLDSPKVFRGSAERGINRAWLGERQPPKGD